MQFPEIVVITEVRARALWPITPSRRPQSRPLEGNFVDKEISPLRFSENVAISHRRVPLFLCSG